MWTQLQSHNTGYHVQSSLCSTVYCMVSEGCLTWTLKTIWSKYVEVHGYIVYCLVEVTIIVQMYTELQMVVFSDDSWGWQTCVKANTRVHVMKAYSRGRGTAPFILNVSTRFRWVVTFMSQVLYPWEESPPYQLKRRLERGVLVLIWIFWRREKSLTLTGNRT